MANTVRVRDCPLTIHALVGLYLVSCSRTALHEEGLDGVAMDATIFQEAPRREVVERFPVPSSPIVPSLASNHDALCFRAEDTSLRCIGQLQQYDLTASPALEPVSIGDQPVDSISAGMAILCFVFRNGALNCRTRGAIRVHASERLRAEFAALRNVAEVSVGPGGCFRKRDSTVGCWPQIAPFDEPREVQPDQWATVSGLPPMRSIVVGGVQTGTDPIHLVGCGLSETGQVWCWNESGSISAPRFTALFPIELNMDVVELADTGQFFCARSSRGLVRCWWMKDVSRDYPSFQPGPLSFFSLPELGPSRVIRGNGATVCSGRVDGLIVCWTYHQTNNQEVQNQYLPAEDSDGYRRFNPPISEIPVGDLSVTFLHVCGRWGSRLFCVGDVGLGILGDPSMRMAGRNGLFRELPTMPRSP